MKFVIALLVFTAVLGSKAMETAASEDAAKLQITQKKGGDGKTFCSAGQKIKADYTGTLTNGQKFDSSVDRGVPFEFTLGRKQVISCWDQGFAKLSVGESARFTCPPALAYGKDGFPGAIPPDSTLIFDVKLIACE